MHHKHRGGTNRKKLWMLAILAGAVAGGYALWSGVATEQERWDLMANCLSDVLSPLASDLQQYAEQHDRSFPEAGRLIDAVAARGTGAERMLACSKSKRPYLINPDLGKIRLDSREPRLLVWCPEGSHGRFCGAAVVQDGQVHAQAMTESELRQWLERERTRGVQGL